MSAIESLPAPAEPSALTRRRWLPLVWLGLVLAAVGTSAALTRKAPTLLAADTSAKVVGALAACALAAFAEQTLYAALRRRSAILRGAAAAFVAVIGAIVSSAGLVAGLGAAVPIGDRGTLALCLFLFGLWLCGAAVGTVLAGNADSPSRTLQRSIGASLVLVFIFAAAIGVAAGRFGPRLASLLLERMPDLFAPWAALRLPGSWPSAKLLAPIVLLLLFALAASLSATNKLLAATMEHLDRFRMALDDAARGRLAPRSPGAGPREVSGLSERHSRMLESIAQVRDLERRFSPKTPAALEQLRKLAPNARLAPSAGTATVVVAELRELATSLKSHDATQMVWLFGRFFDRMATVVDKYGGYLERVGSDALIAVFNVPFAQTDHIVKGTRSAIDMQTELVSLNREERVRPLGSLRLAIGVATGQVFTGTTEGEDGRFLLVGETIELAAALASLTPVGQVWVNQHNAETLPMYIPSVMLAAVPVRGRAQPVAPYRVWPPP